MKTIEIDDVVYDKLSEIAIPFDETTPNMVLRRVLGIGKKGLMDGDDEQIDGDSSYSMAISKTTSESIQNLRKSTPHVHPAFLTFLMDKRVNTQGNYQISEIIPFMKAMYLKLPSGMFRNPWMKRVYGGEKNGVPSCTRTIEHFRQARKFGCWNGKDQKSGCNAVSYCIYHPENPHKINNKCDLRKEVIWKRYNPTSPFLYGANYTNVVKTQLLHNMTIPLKPLLAVFYPEIPYDDQIVMKFKNEFHMTDQEMEFFTE